MKPDIRPDIKKIGYPVQPYSKYSILNCNPYLNFFDHGLELGLGDPSQVAIRRGQQSRGKSINE